VSWADSIYTYIFLIQKIYILILHIWYIRGGIVKTIKDFYLEKKKEAFLNVVYVPPKDKHKESQETLNRYVKYIPRLRKLKEAEYFREEFMEPEVTEVKT